MTSLGRGSGTAEQLCSGSCDTLGHSWLEGTVSLGHCQYNAFQELDGDWLLPSIKHPGGEQWGWRWSCSHWCVSQSPSKRACPQHWSLLGSPAHLIGWRCVTVDHRVRQYFVTASLKELGITAEPTEKYPHCKEDTNFLKQLVLQVHQASVSMVSLIETSRTFEE